MIKTAWGLLIVLVLGVLGPRLTPDGVSLFSGEQRRQAEDALIKADMHMDNPVENPFVQRFRVTQVVSLQPTDASRDDTTCRWAKTVRAYTLFWFHRTLVVKCASVSG